jgi:hypothetical protein
VTQRRRSHNELRGAVPDIDFELSQLVDTAVLLREFRESQNDLAPAASRQAAIEVASLESGLLHLRNVIDFFNTDQRRDITARDFLDGERWAIPRTDAWKRLRSVRKMLDKHLSHISWERVIARSRDPGGENPVWPLERLADDSLEVSTAFVGELRARDLESSDWFDSTLVKAYLGLRDTWPEGVPAPLPGSTLNFYLEGPEASRRGRERLGRRAHRSHVQLSRAAGWPYRSSTVDGRVASAGGDLGR